MYHEQFVITERTKHICCCLFQHIFWKGPVHFLWKCWTTNHQSSPCFTHLQVINMMPLVWSHTFFSLMVEIMTCVFSCRSSWQSGLAVVHSTWSREYIQFWVSNTRDSSWTEPHHLIALHRRVTSPPLREPRAAVLRIGPAPSFLWTRRVAEQKQFSTVVKARPICSQ
jgi:hypothetical protein